MIFDQLNVRDGVLSTIEIPDHWENIDLKSCHTNQVLIDSGSSDYKLKVFTTTGCNKFQKI